MKPINKLQRMVNEVNERRVRELCDWMAANCDGPVGWDALTAQSGLSHRDLITLFEVYVKTSPMTYLRRCRENRRLSGSANSSGSLFTHQDRPTDGDDGAVGV